MAIGLILHTAIVAAASALAAPLPLKKPLEATARKGPVQITLRMYTPTIRTSRSVSDSSGEDAIVCQLVVKNVGHERIFISDRALLGEAPLTEGRINGYGIDLIVHKKRGEGPFLKPGSDRVVLPGSAEWTFYEAIASRTDELVKKGMAREDAAAQADQEISARVAKPTAKPFWLDPGASTGTAVEILPYFFFASTGAYTITARYDHVPRRKRTNRDPEAVKVQTPPLTFEVVP